MLIQTEFQQSPFVAVPRHVVQMVGTKISPEALGVLVWLAARPVGAQVSVPHISRAMGFGKDKWQRIGRELRAVGALFSMPVVCNETGRVYGQALGVRWPDAPKAKAKPQPKDKPKASTSKPEKPASTESRKTRLSPPSPRAGFSGYKKPENPAPSYKEYIIKEGEGPSGATVADRRQVAADLGLPVLNPETGEWVRPRKIAENEGVPA